MRARGGFLGWEGNEHNVLFIDLNPYKGNSHFRKHMNEHIYPLRVNHLNVFRLTVNVCNCMIFALVQIIMFP